MEAGFEDSSLTRSALGGFASAIPLLVS